MITLMVNTADGLLVHQKKQPRGDVVKKAIVGNGEDSNTASACLYEVLGSSAFQGSAKDTSGSNPNM